MIIDAFIAMRKISAWVNEGTVHESVSDILQGNNLSERIQHHNHEGLGRFLTELRGDAYCRIGRRADRAGAKFELPS